MRVLWSLPVRGERLHSCRGDLVRARSLIDALRADGHDVEVVEAAAHYSGQLAVSGYRSVVRRLLPSRLALVLRDAGRLVDGVIHGLRVATRARWLQAELIIESQVAFSLSGMVAARLTGQPLILDDCSPSQEEASLGVGLPSVATWVLRQQAREAKAVVATSRAGAGQLVAEGVPTYKICFVPNGVDLSLYQRADRESVRQQLNLTNRRVVGFVGSFQPWHAVELLVEAMARLPAKYPVHLLLIGDGPRRQAVLASAHRLGVDSRMIALGAVSPGTVPTLISSFDIGVLPGSNSYGHPMKLVEYAAAGVAMVAPDLPPVREVIRHGETGLLFRPGDLDELSNALVRLVADEDLRNRLGAQARRSISIASSWQKRAQVLLKNFLPGELPFDVTSRARRRVETAEVRRSRRDWGGAHELGRADSSGADRDSVQPRRGRE